MSRVCPSSALSLTATENTSMPACLNASSSATICPPPQPVYSTLVEWPLITAKRHYYMSSFYRPTIQHQTSSANARESSHHSSCCCCCWSYAQLCMWRWWLSPPLFQSGICNFFQAILSFTILQFDAQRCNCKLTSRQAVPTVNSASVIIMHGIAYMLTAYNMLI